MLVGMVPSGPLQMVTTSASPPIGRASLRSVSAARPLWRRVALLLGLLLGALVLVVHFNIAVIIGLPLQAQLVVKGIMIIVAAAIIMRGARLR